MSTSLLLLLAACILFVAVLYSCVGHGGASGYIAILALFSLAPAVFKPTALVLNWETTKCYPPGSSGTGPP